MAQPNANNTAFRFGTSIEVASGATSAQSAAVSANCRMIRVTCTAAARIAIGASPTAAATSTLINPAGPEFIVVSGSDKVAAIQEAVAGKVSITEVES